MRRVLGFTGGLAVLVLSVLTSGGCGDAQSGASPLVGVGGGSAPTAGFAAGGTIVVSLGGTISGGGDPFFDSCEAPSPHFAPTRRSIADLDGSLDLVLGAGRRLADALPPEKAYERSLTSSFVSALLQVARERVEPAAKEASDLSVCEVEDESNGQCVQTWLRDYGLQLYRRPLAEEQVQAYLVAYESARLEMDAVGAAKTVLVSMILSPYFVLRIELGGGEGNGQLSQYEVASRISHFAVRRAPDRELLKSAAEGELARPEIAVLHLRRLWSTPEGRAVRELMILEWLGLQNPSPRTDLPLELRADMDAQLRGYIAHVFDAKNGALDALLTGSRFPINARLASHYGVTIEAGEDLELRELEPSLFAGPLSSGAFLSRVPTPSLRGERIMNALLCADVAFAPVEAHSQPLPPAPTPRERLAAGVQSRPQCQGCHQTFDSAGLALSAFDSEGRLSGWDSSGSLTPTPTDKPVPVANPQALATAILSSTVARECLGRRYLELLLDREVPSRSLLYIQVPRPRSPERHWLDCFSRTLGTRNPSLIGFAESLVQSKLMRWRDDAPHRLLAFDTSVDPLEHAYQEALQLDNAYPNPEDAALIAQYARALDERRTLGDAAPAGDGGAGGQGLAGAGGAP